MALTADEITAKARTHAGIAHRLEHLAKVIDWLTGSQPYAQQMAPEHFADIRISWNLGSALEGYSAVNGLVSKRIQALMPNLLRDVLLEAQREVAEILREKP